MVINNQNNNARIFPWYEKSHENLNGSRKEDNGSIGVCGMKFVILFVKVNFCLISDLPI